MRYARYRPAEERIEIPLRGRTWPDRRLVRAPLWASVDLRDGNQALAEPMDPARKRRMFDTLLRIGFKEIEVGYPSASLADFEFARHLADEDAIPDDVTPVVFTPGRRDLVERTFEAVAGYPRAVIHLCVATAPAWREVVLGGTRAEVLKLILTAGEDVLRLAERYPGVDLHFQFSPEVFNLTEPDYVLEVCDTLTALWDACPQRPVRLNLPTTVETTTPNLFADQIEYMSRQLARRDGVILSVHPHNDRGTGVASAELALLAGAERVEGCLFGNGERTGNVDLVTLALNLHSQGVDPMLDLTDIDEVRRTVEYCNRMVVPERHPYGGDLVYTAFSGTHQDAISKGLAHHRKRAAQLGVPVEEAPWEVPYLPIDPSDVGRDYAAVVRINSQSGKGGIAHLLHQTQGLQLPRRLQIEFSRFVQSVSDASGAEVTAKHLWDLFRGRYLDPDGPVTVDDWRIAGAAAEGYRFAGTLKTAGGSGERVGAGPTPSAALVAALGDEGIDVELLEQQEQPLTDGQGGVAVYVECRIRDRTLWGVGLADSPADAQVRAVLSACNRALAD
ncbi:2-isopropylmalate synthase [Micromonospora sp. NPDC049051]|uniref:2-isopropylmalate synthase n=1 Tax=unclassified Micromonospora TaxID=2617518 RepID=UPI00371CDF93